MDYLGDDHFHQAMQHGNSKHDSEFVRTMQSVVEEIKCKEEDPHKVYKKMICTNVIEGSHQAVANPRNTKQVKNILNKGNNKITELRTILQRESQNS